MDGRGGVGTLLGPGTTGPAADPGGALPVVVGWPGGGCSGPVVWFRLHRDTVVRGFSSSWGVPARVGACGAGCCLGTA